MSDGTALIFAVLIAFILWAGDPSLMDVIIQRLSASQ